MKNRTKLPNIYLGVILALLYVPILLVVFYSFNESKISSVWGGFSLKWYEALFRDKALFKALGNSLILGSTSCLCAAVIGTLGAYGMTKARLRTKGAVEYISTLPIMIPEIILGMVFMAFFSLIGIPFGMGTLVLAHTAFCIPYIFMLVKARLVGMDPSLAEAALDLGASRGYAFFKVIFPDILPGILTGFLLSFTMSLDDFVITHFTKGMGVDTLSTKIYAEVRKGIKPEIYALSTIMFVVVFVMLVMINRKNGKNENKERTLI